MRILIAAAAGAIGRPLVRRLRANRHEVFALTRSPDSAPAVKEIGAEAVIGDALDAAAVKAAVVRIRPDADARGRSWPASRGQARTVEKDSTRPRSRSCRWVHPA